MGEVLPAWIQRNRGLWGHTDPNSLCLNSQCNWLALELPETLALISMSEFPFPGSVKLLVHVCEPPRLPQRRTVMWGVTLGVSEAAPRAHVLVVGEGYALCVLPWERRFLAAFCRAKSPGSLLNGGA